jgi:predicted neuraminidase
MPLLIRILGVILLWLLCWGVIRKMPQAGTGGFVAGQVRASMGECKPVFSSETINPDQGLPMVHVAALAQTPDGILHAVWYGGTAECRPDVNIYLAHKEPGGRWTQPVVILTRSQAEKDLGRPLQALGNALLIGESDGSLRLLFVTIAMGKWSGSQLNSCISKDGGLSWSRAEHLTLSPFFNLSELVRNRPVALRDGGWCVPVYQEFLGKFPELLWLGKDGSYRKSRIAGGCTSFQPSVVPLDGRRAIALMRDYTPARRIHLARTEDGGRTWTKPVPTSLPNPDAGVSAVRLSDGRILLSYNDSATDRKNLSWAISPDDGGTWQKIAAPDYRPIKSFAYPYLMRDGQFLFQAFTGNGKLIELDSFNEAFISEMASPAKP